MLIFAKLVNYSYIQMPTVTLFVAKFGERLVMICWEIILACIAWILMTKTLGCKTFQIQFYFNLVVVVNA